MTKVTCQARWDTKNTVLTRSAVNGHVEARYVEGTGWHSPRFVRDPYLRIHGLSPSLNYGRFSLSRRCLVGDYLFSHCPGQEAYEGMKGEENTATSRGVSQPSKQLINICTIILQPIEAQPAISSFSVRRVTQHASPNPPSSSPSLPSP